VKVNVASTPALPATRSEAATLNVTEVTAPLITPHDTAGLDGVGSALVCTVTESEAALATPMVQPTSVTVTAVPAASVPPAAANTMDVLPGAPGVSVTPAVDAWAVGVADVAKKPDG
jgi:hypothetical protein